MQPWQLLVWIIGIFFSALVEGLAEYILNQLAQRTERLFSSGQQGRALRGEIGEYLEGAIEIFTDLLRADQRRGTSKVLLLLKVMGCMCLIAWLAARLWLNNVMYPLTVFQKSVVLATMFDGSLDTCFTPMRHLIDHSGGAYLVLDAKGRVRHWDRSAQELFKFRTSRVMNKVATRSFIPGQETGGRCLSILLQDLCRHPDTYRLNLNENITASGERFWTLWLNLPIHQQGKLKQIHCIGFRIETPKMVRFLIRMWRTSSQKKIRSVVRRLCRLRRY